MSDGWVYGLDTGSKALGIGVVEIPTGKFGTFGARWRPERERDTLPLARSLALAEEHTRSLLWRLKRYMEPATVAVEQPMGTHNNPSLVMHAGVEFRAAHAVLELEPWLVNVSTWKRTVSGQGNWPKDQLLPWCAGLGYPIDDVDQAAGLAIAAAAASIYFGLDLELLHPATQPARRAA